MKLIPCSVWRPLKGPNDDWPLALCDFRTINIENDFIPNDVVYENSVGEDEFLRSNNSHEWYYMSRHTVDEVVVWRNTNLPNGEKPRESSWKPASGGPDRLTRV